MHGAGNDFLVFDGIHQQIAFTPDQWKQLANRHTGVGADQMLVVERTSLPNVDFKYRIFNADGGEVQHCGNGARAFVKFVHEKKLTDKTLADAKETSDKMEKQTGEKPTKDVIDTIIRDKLNKNLTNECIKEATTGIASVEERKALIEAQYQDKKVQDDMIEKKKEQLS